MLSWSLPEVILMLSWCHPEVVLKTSWRHPEDILKTSWRHPQDILKTSWRHHEDIMKTSWRHHEVIMKSSWSHHEVIIKSSWSQNIKIMRSRTLGPDIKTDKQTLAFLELLTEPKIMFHLIYWKNSPFELIREREISSSSSAKSIASFLSKTFPKCLSLLF